MLAALAAAAVTTTGCKKTPLPPASAEDASTGIDDAAADARASFVGQQNWTLDELNEVHTTKSVDAIIVYANHL